MLLLLRNADLFDPDPRGVRDLLICGRRLVDIGAPGEISLSGVEFAERDLAEARTFPALVDPHVHVTGGGGEAGPGSRVPPPSPSHYTGAGIGTVVGLLGTDDTTRTPGDLVAWAAELRAHGLGAWCWTGGYHVPPATVTGTVRGDMAWVESIIGVGEVAISDHRSSHPSTAELVRIAADAHVGGLMTGKAGILHLHVGDGPAGLEPVREALRVGDVPARTYHPTHVNRRRALLDEAFELVRAGCHIDVTAFPVAENEDAWDAGTAVRRYLDAGLPADRISVSSDGGGCLPVFDDQGRVVAADVARPGALFGCLRALLAAGVDLEDALPAFTRNAADLLRLADRGRLTPGAVADLVVLDDDDRLSDVLLAGRWHMRDGSLRVRGPFEERS